MGNGSTSQLDYILGPEMASNQVCVHNDVKLWGTWAHHPIYVMIQEDDAQTCFTQKKKKKKWSGWRPSKIDFKKTGMNKKGRPKRRRGGSEEGRAHHEVR